MDTDGTLKAQVKVLCWDPEKTKKSTYKTYEVPYSRTEKVLGSLIYIHQHLDSCLSFRFNCKGRHCGECAMMINGTPGLSCEVSMSRDLVLEPLKHLPLVKDLVIHRTEVCKKTIESLPRIGVHNKKGDSLRAVPLEVVDRVVLLDRCIQCLCCLSVCPVYKKGGKDFVGPMGLLAMAASLTKSSNFGTYKEASLCTECSRCEHVCPRRIPILQAMRRLKGA